MGSEHSCCKERTEEPEGGQKTLNKCISCLFISWREQLFVLTPFATWIKRSCECLPDWDRPVWERCICVSAKPKVKEKWVTNKIYFENSNRLESLYSFPVTGAAQWCDREHVETGHRNHVCDSYHNQSNCHEVFMLWFHHVAVSKSSEASIISK